MRDVAAEAADILRSVSKVQAKRSEVSNQLSVQAPLSVKKVCLLMA